MGSKVADRSKKIRFKDKNLQLALLDEIHHHYNWLAAHEADYEDTRGSHPTWPTWAAIRDNENAHYAALEQYLLTVKLPAAKLAAIKQLTLDGDRDVYGWVYPFWWEFGNHFTISDLSGIELCSRIEYLLLGQGLVDGCSLRPLRGLKALKELHICALCNHRDIDALLEIPNLKKLDIVNVASSPERDEWETVIDQLCKQGLPSLSRR